jgi:hypothetical protein
MKMEAAQVPSIAQSVTLRKGTSVGLLWTRQWTFGFHKMLGSSRVAAQLAASEKVLGSIKLVSYSVSYTVHKITVEWVNYTLQNLGSQQDKSEFT